MNEKRKVGRPGNISDPRFVVFIVHVVEGWLARQGSRKKRPWSKQRALSISQACRNVMETTGVHYLRTADSVRLYDELLLYVEGLRRDRQAGLCDEEMPLEKRLAWPPVVDHRITNARTLSNVYFRCLRWLDANPDSPAAQLIEREREGRRLRGRIGKPPEFLCN